MSLEFTNEKKQNLHFYYESSCLIDYQDSLDLYGVNGGDGGLPMFIAGKLRTSVAAEVTLSGISLSVSSPGYFIVNYKMKKFEGFTLNNHLKMHEEHFGASYTGAKLSELHAKAENIERSATRMKADAALLESQANYLRAPAPNAQMPDGGAAGLVRSIASASAVTKIAALIAIAAAGGVSGVIAQESIRARYGAIHPTNSDAGGGEGEGGEGEGGEGDGEGGGDGHGNE